MTDTSPLYSSQSSDQNSELPARPHLDADGHIIEHEAEEFAAPTPAPGEQPWEKKNREWYKDAVFYEVLVRAFYDPEGHGSGSLKGLTEKLDYIQWLGVDCIWIPPFYDSPLRDGGYDIRNFREILPEFGTVEDFVELVDQAHRRGLRVITDLVMNHTSDQHPWFQESRRDPAGPYGDFYVWGDDPTMYGKHASSSSTQKNPTGPLILCVSNISGTDSSPTNQISTMTILWSKRQCLMS